MSTVRPTECASCMKVDMKGILYPQPLLVSFLPRAFDLAAATTTTVGLVRRGLPRF